MAPRSEVPETAMDVAPAVAPLPIAAFKSKSPVISIAPRSYNTPIVSAVAFPKITSAVVPLSLLSKSMVNALLVASSELTVPLKVMLLSVVVNVTSTLNVTAPSYC